MLTPTMLARKGDEDSHQTALFCWAAIAAEHGVNAAFGYTSQGGNEPVPALRALFAIPNGGERNKIVAARLKMQGVRSGVPDIMLAYPCVSYAGLFIELKRPKLIALSAKRIGKTVVARAAGRVSEEQTAWIDRLKANRYAVAVCYGWEEAATVIIQYLRGIDV